MLQQGVLYALDPGAIFAASLARLTNVLKIADGRLDLPWFWGRSDRSRLAESLGRINRLDQADFGIDDAAYQALGAWVDQTRDTLERHP